MISGSELSADEIFEFEEVGIGFGDRRRFRLLRLVELALEPPREIVLHGGDPLLDIPARSLVDLVLELLELRADLVRRLAEFGEAAERGL